MVKYMFPLSAKTVLFKSKIRLGEQPATKAPNRFAVWFLIVFSWLLIFAVNSRAAQAPDAEAELVRAMTEQIDCYPLEFLDFHKQKPLISVKELCLAAIYQQSGTRPLWVGINGPDHRAEIILNHLQTAYQDGVDPRDYEIELLESLWPSRTPVDLARLDLQLTYSLVKYIHDMSFGQMKFRFSDQELYGEVGNDQFDPLQALEIARTSPDIGAYLDSLAPQHSYYQQLKKVLQYYRGFVQRSDWPAIPAGPLIRPGKKDERLAAIQYRLSLTEDIETTLVEPENYDDNLVAAVQLFQKNNGLKPDGVVGPQTLAMLNRTPAELVDTIRANMARWRWQSHQLGDTYIMVNIAAFSLKAVRNNQVVLEMPVIVGKFQHQTPIISDSIKYLDFNPYWNVPPSIARNEELPALQQNPNYLIDRHVRLFSSWQRDAVELDSTAIDWKSISRSQIAGFKLRQDPGPWNALGRVKFVFPNHNSIYLHDTPTQNLFEQTSRSFSHGCIRVSQPLVLALFCLNQQNSSWTTETIDKIVSTEERKVIILRPPIPIHINYQTVWLDNNEIIHFNSDIYGRDAKLMKAFDAK